MATTEQIDMLRAMVEADFDRHEEISHRLRDQGELDGYGTVIGAAFFLAIRMQFPDAKGTPAEITRLVADTRAVFDLTGDLIDPRAAELVVRTALGEPEAANSFDDATVIQAQMAVASFLAGEQRLGDTDKFMERAQNLIAQWEAADD